MTGTGSSCGACKFLRRRCSKDCVFAPYFCYEEAASHFEAVHRVFGASNVSKLLLHLPVQDRREAAITVSYEALARMQDPIYGCVAHIFALQQQVACLKEEIELIGNHIATFSYSNSEPIFSCYDHLIQQNYMNEHTQPLGLTGIEQLPQPNSWESADISQTLFVQANHQTVDQQYLWTGTCSNNLGSFT